jgi:plastocyanin
MSSRAPQRSLVVQRHLLFVSILLLVPGLAAAQQLTGVIEPAALRRKVDLVYVERVEGKVDLPAEKPVMNQKGNVYLPHILPVVAGSTVAFKSEDPELHNVFARGGRKVMFNQPVLPQKTFDRLFAEVGVVHLSCNIHKEMSAYVVVLQNPYFTRPDAKTGAFTIQGVPAGQYTVRIWGEALSEEDQARKFTVTVGPDAAPLRVASR